MIVINAIIDNAYTIVCEWSPEPSEYDPDAEICLIIKVEETMHSFCVPLPANEIIQPLLEQKDYDSIGKPFDGLRLSYISKQRR